MPRRAASLQCGDVFSCATNKCRLTTEDTEDAELWSVGSSSGIALATRPIAAPIAWDAAVSDDSISWGICDRRSSLRAASSCGCSASSGNLYLVRNRRAAESSNVADARGYI